MEGSQGRARRTDQLRLNINLEVMELGASTYDSIARLIVIHQEVEQVLYKSLLVKSIY